MNITDTPQIDAKRVRAAMVHHRHQAHWVAGESPLPDVLLPCPVADCPLGHGLSIIAIGGRDDLFVERVACVTKAENCGRTEQAQRVTWRWVVVRGAGAPV